jgi:hypothetical protein
VNYYDAKLKTGMSPRDMWDANPVYTLHFWNSYENVLQLIGFREDREELVNPHIPEIPEETEEIAEEVNESDEEKDVEEGDYDWRYEEYYDMDMDTDDDYSDWGDDLEDLPSMDDIVSFM